MDHREQYINELCDELSERADEDSLDYLIEDIVAREVYGFENTLRAALVERGDAIEYEREQEPRYQIGDKVAVFLNETGETVGTVVYVYSNNEYDVDLGDGQPNYYAAEDLRLVEEG